MASVWLALLFLVAVIVGGSVYSVVRVRESYRAVRSMAGGLAAEAGAMATRAERTEEELRKAAAGLERLDVALTQLSRSMARLRILRGSLGDIERALGVVRTLRGR